MSLPQHDWELEEEFDTDPSSRGWSKVGTQIDWDNIEEAFGDTFALRIWPTRQKFTKGLSSLLTQDDDISIRIKFEHEGTSLGGLDYGNCQTGFFNTADDTQKNKLIIFTGRRSYPYPGGDYPNHGFSIQVIDKNGVAYGSPFSSTLLKTADFPKTFFLILHYTAATRGMSLKIYDDSENYIETLYLSLPSGIEFTIDEIGNRSRDFGSSDAPMVWVQGWVKEFYLTDLGAPFVGQSFKLLVDNVEFIPWSSINFGGSIGSLRGIGINIPNPQGKHTGRFHVNQQLEVQYRGINEPAYRTVYKGYGDHPTSSVQGKNAQIVISGRDNGVPLTDEKCVDETFTPYLSLTDTDPFDIVSYIISKLATAVPIAPGSRRNEVPLPVDYDFDREKWCIDVVKKLAGYGDYEWFINYNGEFLMRPPKELIDANISKVYILGTKADFLGSLPNDNIGYILSENVGEDGTDVVNSMGLQGKDKFVYHTDAASVAALRLRHDYIEDAALASDQLQEIVIAMANRRKQSRRSFGFVVPGTFEIDRGDIVYVDDRVYGFSGQPGKLYKISGKTDNISKTKFISTLQLADNPLKVSDVLDLFG